MGWCSRGVDGPATEEVAGPPSWGSAAGTTVAAQVLDLGEAAQQRLRPVAPLAGRRRGVRGGPVRLGAVGAGSFSVATIR